MRQATNEAAANLRRPDAPLPGLKVRRAKRCASTCLAQPRVKIKSKKRARSRDYDGRRLQVHESRLRYGTVPYIFGADLTTEELQPRQRMRPYTTKEKAKITAGAVAALVMTGMLFVLVLTFLQTP